MFRWQFLVLTAAMFCTTAAAVAETNVDPTGIWLTETGDAKIRVSQCGSAICGTVVWLKAPIDPATGKPQVDDKNINPALSHRPIIGINIFAAMKPVGDRKWSGRIYNATMAKPIRAT